MENSKCAQLLQSLSEASFFALDLQLYLDTHPDDEEALSLFVEACKQRAACKEAFERCCYPLTACSSGKNGEWDWLCGAFPPERL